MQQLIQALDQMQGRNPYDQLGSEQHKQPSVVREEVHLSLKQLLITQASIATKGQMLLVVHQQFFSPSVTLALQLQSHQGD